MPKKVTIKAKKKGQHDISFKPGTLHAQLGVAQGEKIPSSKMSAAMSGSYGPMAKKRAQFAKNVLTGGK